MTKRLSSGRFRFWCESGTEPSVRVASHQLQTLAAAGNWTQVTAAETWRSVER